MLSKTDNHNYVHVCNIKDIESVGGCLSVTVEKHSIAIFIYDSKVYAVDNREFLFPVESLHRGCKLNPHLAP